jgi:hypothetical protein
MALTYSIVLGMAREGELKQLSSKDKNQDVVIGFINLALVALYSRFTIKTQEIILALGGDNTEFKLDGTDSRVTVGNVVYNPAVHGGVMSILGAYEEDGSSISLNNEKDPFSVFTPSYDTVQVPVNTTGQYISIVFKCNPKFITVTDSVSDPIIPIPLVLLEPLLHYIGYRAHGSVDGNINTENNTHYMRYEASCQAIERLGSMTADDVSSQDISVKGYV